MSSDGITPSSPAALFSDHTTVPSSPPSSPPGFPWEQDYAGAKPEPNTRTSSAFTVLGKRKALGDTSNNVRPAKKASTPSTKAPKVAMTQMQLSLGQEVRKRCKTCGMEYTLSSAEDRTLHDKYHKQNTEGYDVGKDFFRNAAHGPLFVRGPSGDVICRVDANDRQGRKTRCQAVLEIVQRELGAVEIDAQSLWDKSKSCHRSYLYLRGTRCVGYILVEDIKEARVVVYPGPPVPWAPRKTSGASAALTERRRAAAVAFARAESARIDFASTPCQAELGVSRIWTSSSCRRQNIATALLDVALADHSRSSKPINAVQGDGGLGVTTKQPPSKDIVAFSQPTESGTRLARKWSGKLFGWKVYFD